jgi:hypothetical protein
MVGSKVISPEQHAVEGLVLLIQLFVTPLADPIKRRQHKMKSNIYNVFVIILFIFLLFALFIWMEDKGMRNPADMLAQLMTIQQLTLTKQINNITNSYKYIDIKRNLLQQY